MDHAGSRSERRWKPAESRRRAHSATAWKGEGDALMKEIKSSAAARAEAMDASAEDAHNVPPEQQNDTQCTCGRARKRGLRCDAHSEVIDTIER